MNYRLKATAMRVSIWLQFASNHSNSFMIVGTFQNFETATAAAARLQHILSTIVQARAANDYGSELTSAEREFSREFDVEWSDSSLDWLRADHPLSEHITVFENHVFVTNDVMDTYLGAKPIDALLMRLGGQVIVQAEMQYAYIAADLSCTAPDVATALHIAEVANRYFRTRDDSWDVERVPWLVYHAGVKDERASELLKLEDVHITREQAEKRFIEEHRELRAKVIDETGILPTGQRSYGPLHREYDALHEQMLRALPSHSLEQREWFNRVYFATCADAGQATAEGRRIQFHGARFCHPGRALPALIAYLSDHGCIDIRYRILRTPGV